METVLKDIIEKHYSYLEGKKLGEHRKSELLLGCIVNLVTNYTDFMGCYPYTRYTYDYRLDIRPKGKIAEIVTNNTIRDFLLENNIHDEKDFEKLRERVSAYRGIMPSYPLSLSLERKIEEIKKKLPFYKRYKMWLL